MRATSARRPGACATGSCPGCIGVAASSARGRGDSLGGLAVLQHTREAGREGLGRRLDEDGRRRASGPGCACAGWSRRLAGPIAGTNRSSAAYWCRRCAATPGRRTRRRNAARRARALPVNTSGAPAPRRRAESGASTCSGSPPTTSTRASGTSACQRALASSSSRGPDTLERSRVEHERRVAVGLMPACADALRLGRRRLLDVAAHHVLDQHGPVARAHLCTVSCNSWQMVITTCEPCTMRFGLGERLNDDDRLYLKFASCCGRLECMS